MKSVLTAQLVTRLRDNTTAYGGLHYFDASSLGIGPRDLSIMAELIRANGVSQEGFAPLISIDLSNNFTCGIRPAHASRDVFDSDGLQDLCNALIALAKNSRLRKLNLSRNEIRGKGFSIIGHMLCNGLTSLMELHLKSCLGDSEGIEKLVEGIKTQKCIAILDLSDNMIGPAGAVYIADLFSLHTRLRQLVLNSCQLGSEGADTVLLAASATYGLETLQLNDNNIGDHGCEAISHLLRSPTSRLKHLDLKENAIGYIGLSMICKALAKNKWLLFLGLEWNDITNEGARALGEVLTLNNTLRAIHLLGNHVDQEGLEAMIAGSTSNESRPVDLDLSHFVRPRSRQQKKTLRSVELAAIPIAKDSFYGEDDGMSYSTYGESDYSTISGPR